MFFIVLDVKGNANMDNLNGLFDNYTIEIFEKKVSNTSIKISFRITLKTSQIKSSMMIIRIDPLTFYMSILNSLPCTHTITSPKNTKLITLLNLQSI